MSARLRAMVLAMVLATGFGLTAAHLMETGDTGVNPCANFTPDDWFWWWFYGCEKDSSGGGGSGAGN